MFTCICINPNLSLISTINFFQVFYNSAFPISPFPFLHTFLFLFIFSFHSFKKIFFSQLLWRKFLFFFYLCFLHIFRIFLFNSNSQHFSKSLYNLVSFDYLAFLKFHTIIIMFNSRFYHIKSSHSIKSI